MEAYRAYLQGNAEYKRSWSAKSVETAIGFFERAVALEPDYPQALAKLGWMHCWMNQLGLDPSEERLVRAKTAIDRALALDSSLAEAHVAMGLYWYWGRDDYDRALVEFGKAAQLEPSYAEASHQIGNVRRRQGRFAEAIASYRMSADLNPQFAGALFTLGDVLLIVRQYEEATGIFTRVTELSPEFLEGYLQQARVAVSARGDIEAARRILTIAEERIPPTDWRAPMINWQRIVNAGNLQTYVDRLRPKAYGLDSATYHLVKARFLRQMGERDSALSQYDSARIVYERRRSERPGDAGTHAALGEIYAALSRPAEAVASGHRAAEILPISKDALDGPEMLTNLGNIYVMLGDADSAAAYYYRALSIPSYFSLNLLRADPLLASFVSTRQFQDLSRRLAAAAPARKAEQHDSTEERRVASNHDDLTLLSWTFVLSTVPRLRKRLRRRPRERAR